jgi:hypothetical protein
MADSVQAPQAHVATRRRVHHRLLGLGLGLIPLIVALVGLYIGTVGDIAGIASLTGEITLAGTRVLVWGLVLMVGGALYLVTLVAMIICRLRPPLRDVGDGLLTAVLLTPLLFFLVGFVIVVIGLRGPPLPF